MELNALSPKKEDYCFMVMANAFCEIKEVGLFL